MTGKTDLPRGPVVLFATPFRAPQLSVEYHVSMVQTALECIRHGIRWDSRLVNGQHFLDLTRNRLVDFFLKNQEFTDLFFIDDDQGWDAKVIPRFLAYDEEVVCGLPPKKSDEPDFHCNALTGVIQNKLFQSHEAGTGFMRIKRSAFEKLEARFPELKTDGGPENKETAFFQTTIYKGGKLGGLGEDIFFCRKWRELGEWVWIDSDVTFTHRGGKVWKGNFYEHAVLTGMLVKNAEAA